MALLEVRNLKTYFDTPEGTVKAVNGVSFTIEPGETLGIVGESGSGKSVMSLSLMQLNPSPPVYYPEGEILYQGKNLLEADENEMRRIRGNEIGMIFQDPLTSLNPVMKVGKQIMEAIRIHQNVSKSEARKQALQLLKDVGIANPEKRLDEYPHQFSGGMRQRAMIAMALACSPKLLIADEPTTALDVTIQAQILDLMTSLQERYGTAVIMITHDLGVVARTADRVMVMYGGKVVETGKTEDVFYRPQMPYTWSLLRSIPRLDGESDERLQSIQGQPPSLIHQTGGCAFEPRCPFAMKHCASVEPKWEEVADGHFSACHLSAEEVRKLMHANEKPEVMNR